MSTFIYHNSFSTMIEQLETYTDSLRDDQSTSMYSYTPKMITNSNTSYLTRFTQELNKKRYDREDASIVISNAIDNKLIDPSDMELIFKIDKNEEFTALTLINLITCINYFRCGKIKELLNITKNTIYENILDFLFYDLYKREKNAMELLIYISHIKSEYFSLSFLAELTQFDDERLFSGINCLRKFSIIKNANDPSTKQPAAFYIDEIAQCECRNFLKKYLRLEGIELVYQNLVVKFEDLFSPSDDEKKRKLDMSRNEYSEHLVEFVENFKNFDRKEKEFLKIESDLLFEIADYYQNHKLDFYRALDVKKEALSMKYKIYDEFSPAIANSYNNIGASYLHLGEYKSSIKFFTKALNIYYKNFNKNAANIANAYNNIGISYQTLGDYKLSIVHLNKSLKLKEEIYDKYHPSIASTLSNIGTCYQYLGQYKTSIEYLNTAFDIQYKLYGLNNPVIADTFNNIGINQQYLEEYKMSIEYFNNALDIYLKTYPISHPSIASVFNNIGLSYQYMKQYKTSIDYFNKSINIKKQFFDASHPSIADTYFNIGLSYQYLKEFSSSLEFFNNALDIYQKYYNENDKNEHLINTLWNIESVKKQLDKREHYNV